MIIKLRDGREYQMWFRYEHWMEHEHVPVGGVQTLCFIRPKDAAKEIVYMWKGHTTCSFKDQFVKAKGRKIALARALAPTLFTRDERQQFWDQYLNRDSGSQVKKETEVCTQDAVC